MKIAVIGKSAFGADVYKRLLQNGHNVVVVCTEPDKNGRADLIALEAEKNGTPVIKAAKWRQKNAASGKWEVVPEVFKQYAAYGAELNVLPFCTQFIPQEVIEFPRHKTIIYHPSLLPAHRGASAINWTLIAGDHKAGLTVFWADEGVDTGPILLQKSCAVEENDTVNSLYKRFLYPIGVDAMVGEMVVNWMHRIVKRQLLFGFEEEAVSLIAAGKAPRQTQPEEGASYESHISAKPELAKIDWSSLNSQRKLHNFIRGNDSAPGAWTTINGERITFFGSSLWKRFDVPGNAREVRAEGVPGGLVWVHAKGLLIRCDDGKYVNVENIKIDDGKMVQASQFGLSTAAEDEALDLTEQEEKIASAVRGIWKAILNMEIDDDSIDFFNSGATSADLTRMLEEINVASGVELENAEAYMNPTFGKFLSHLIKKHRGEEEHSLEFEKFNADVNGMHITVPTQLFIDGRFLSSESGRTMDTINPSTEETICQVPRSSAKDVDLAVRCAHEAFHHGEWSKISARERGKLLYRLADLMEANKQELATIESIDSGAVYTLALKTHVGMSIDVWRYMAGWCDKIQGKTIPISEARPKFNLCVTTREPVGVVGLVTPWNYPLMMLSWKMAACLAAGNTVVHKPAQVSPLTALKFAELTARAGFPRGVVNIMTGTGGEAGQAIVEHPLVRKLGFTGSTSVGARIMASCANSNVKRVSLELGGKSPLIIFADVAEDMQRVARQACDAVFFNKGENCIAAGRLFVEESIHDAFIDRVVSLAEQMVIGDPLDRRTDHGPQNHLAHLKSLEAFVKRAVDEGATIAYGGRKYGSKGLFFYPTVLTNVDDGNFAAKEESFGPIMIVSKFNEREVEEVVQRANRTEFGLAGGVFSKDVSRALRVARMIQAGTVFINTYQKTDVAAPFGGFKQSGYGKDLGEEALNEYLQTKTITIEY